MYPVKTGGAPFRAAGYTLAIVLGIQLLPVQRFGIWATLIGVPYERAIRFHRWLGPIMFAFALLHGFGMLGTYAQSDIGAAYLVEVSLRSAVLLARTTSLLACAKYIPCILRLSFAKSGVSGIRTTPLLVFSLEPCCLSWLSLLCHGFGGAHTNCSSSRTGFGPL